MEKAEPAKEEAKQRLDGSSRFLSVAQPWTVGLAGAGLLLLGLGASTLQPSHGGRSLHQFSSSWQRGGGHKVHLPKKPSKMSDVEDTSADSLEDILDKLDGESPTPRKKVPSSTLDKNRKAGKSKMSVKDEEDLAEDDREEAKELVRNSIKKLEAEQSKKPSAKTRKTLAKLRALLGEEEEPEKEQEPDEEESHQMDFVKALKAEQERKKDHRELTTVKAEFKKDFGADARSLLCSGCRLVASRLTSELEDHDVHNKERPAQLIAAKRKAIDATCSHLQHFGAVISEGGTASFEASEFAGEGEREGKHLCAALLEEARFDMMARLIQRKIPEKAHVYGLGNHDNWERWLCVERTKLCKHSEVKDDPEQEL